MVDMPSTVVDKDSEEQVCLECGSARVHFDAVRCALWQDERLVVVEDIPALVCEGCGEQFYDDATVMLLDILKGRSFPEGSARREIAVPVFSLSDSASWHREA